MRVTNVLHVLHQGEKSVQDDVMSGAPKTVHTRQNIEVRERWCGQVDASLSECRKMNPVIIKKPFARCYTTIYQRARSILKMLPNSALKMGESVPRKPGRLKAKSRQRSSVSSTVVVRCTENFIQKVPFGNISGVLKRSCRRARPALTKHGWVTIATAMRLLAHR